MESYTIKMNATHDGTSMRLAECRFDSRQNARVVRELLAYKFGSNEEAMRLELRDSQDQSVAFMDDE